MGMAANMEEHVDGHITNDVRSTAKVLGAVDNGEWRRGVVSVAKVRSAKGSLFCTYWWS